MSPASTVMFVDCKQMYAYRKAEKSICQILGLVYQLEAYIFVNCDPRILWKTTEAMRKIEGVKIAHTVTGQFDIVAYAEFANMDVLRDIISKVGSIEGVHRTQTAVAIPPRIE